MVQNTLPVELHAILSSGKYLQTFMMDGLVWVAIELLTSQRELLMETELYLFQTRNDLFIHASVDK